jgi:hypothetical protein
MIKQVWVSPTSERWRVKSTGASRAAGLYETKAQAVAAGHEIAEHKHAELFVQNQDGKIGWRNSYGNDPFPPRG